jgi:integrase
MQLGQVFRFARRKKYLTVNPLSDDPIRLPFRESKRKWVPSWDDMDRLVVIGRGRRPNGRQGHPRVSWSNIKVAIALGGGAGLRIGEVVALRWQDIDWINRVLHVRVARGSRGVDLPKKRKIRDVPMTQWVYDTLLDQKHLLETLGRKIDGQILYNRYTKGKPLDQNAVNNTFKRFVVYAGLLESVRGRHEWHTHVLRRFYISARFALQHPPLEILEAVGHEDLKVTMKHYARALPEPPPIWRHRFQPAEPDDATRVIDGSGAVVVDGIAQLPAPEGADIDAGVPEWLREAHRYLEGGWKIKEVAAYFGRSRGHLSEAFRRHGLRPPIEIYRGALYERYEQLYKEGVPPCDIATMTGTSRQTYHAWVTAHEAGVPNTTRSLNELRKSERAQESVARDPKQMKLGL